MEEKPHFGMKLPTGNKIDVMAILRSKTKEISSVDISNTSEESLNSILRNVSIISKSSSKSSKIIKKNQSFVNNQYVSKQWEDSQFERIKIQSDNISGSEEVQYACKQISAAMKLRYKYLFHPHQDCKHFNTTNILKIFSFNIF